MKKSISVKISGVIILLIISVAVINLVLFIRNSNRHIENVLVKKGRALSSSLSRAAETGIVNEDLDLLRRAEYIVHETDVTLSQIFSTTWSAVDAFPFDRLNYPPAPEAIAHFKMSNDLFYKKSDILYDFYSPIFFKPNGQSATILIGYTRISLSSYSLREEMNERLFSDILNFLIIGVLAIIVLNVLMRRIVTSRILKLRKSVIDFQESGIDAALPVSSMDEIGDLVSAFNQMSRTISNDRVEIKKASEQIYNVMQDWENTFHSITDMVTIHDKDFNIIRYNQAAEKILKLSLFGKTADTKCFRYYHGTEKPPEGCPSCDCLKTGQTALFEVFEPHLNRFIEIRAIPRFDRDNNVIGLIHIVRDITEQKQHQDEILKEKDFLQLAINSLPGIFYLFDKEGRFMRWNRYFETVTGYSAEEISRMNPLDFFEGSDKVLIRERIEEVFSKGYSEAEALLTSKLGSQTYFFFNGHIVHSEGKECLIGMGIDIAVRKQMEDDIRKRAAEFQKLYNEFHALLDAIPDNLTLQDRDLKIVWANKGAADSLGKKVEELSGRYCHAMWHNRETPCEECPVEESFRTGKPAALVIKAPDGRLWDLRTFPLTDEGGSVVSVIEVGRDITEQQKTEEHLRQAQKMESVGQLAGGVAHDFNNILTAIINHGYILKRRLEEDRAATESLDKILSLSQNAAKITQELLIFSRKQPLETASLNLNDFISDTLKLLSNFISESIEIRTELTEDAPTIMADRNQMEQVMMNLASNAGDAMPDGGKLIIRTGHGIIDDDFISLHGFGKKGVYAFLSVTDTGLGMDRETVRRAFELFFTTKEVGKGTGLGLSIVYGIIKNHGGFINIYSEPGTGTTFNIYLPETKSETETNEVLRSKIVKGKGETILYAEDDPGVRESMIHILENFNYKVIAVSDGIDAIKTFIEHRDDIDLLVFDIVMPKMGGHKTFQEIRSIMPEMKVIFTSGYANEDIGPEDINEEGIFFMLKPLYPEKLLAKIREVLDY